MNAEEPLAHRLLTPRTARYYTLGGGAPLRQLWIVLHGYGMLPQHWIRKFAPVAAPSVQVVAPEGLSRFYLEGHSGRVGASWMTREDRASEIQDQAVYLNQLLDVVLAQPGYTAGTRLVLFGFSQGVATAWRWFSQGRIVPHHLVLWAGSIPPEPIHHKPMPHTLVAWGDSDPFLPIDQVPDKLQALDALGLSYQPLPYRGGHTLPPDALRALQEKL